MEKAEGIRVFETEYITKAEREKHENVKIRERVY